MAHHTTRDDLFVAAGGGLGTAAVLSVFQYVKRDGAMVARVVIHLLGLAGKPWVLAMDRTSWDFGKTTIKHPHDLRDLAWHGCSADLGVVAEGGELNTRTRVCLLNRLKNTFPDLEIASLMGDRVLIGDRWMAYLI